MRGVLVGALAVVAVLGVAGAVAVPEAKQWYEGRHEEASSYATGQEAKADRKSVPRWLPDGASSVEYAMRTTGGERILKATLPDGKLPAPCQPLDAAKTPEPEIDAAWFPGGITDDAQGRCGSYYVAMKGHTLYAWQTNEDWVEGNRRSAQ
ncbi:hypothetical protein DSC45_29280 [Streptomyces sp. YIM 130001]|uniref:hypothetical protein n=1 Tax=Streptomyces sp. YIM 130001 TaxID=2259644 RepID=UPI000E655944|nr:hypothetical protein [Streptomyces sp. YIM 130001]RII11155.1 hypothetical protein DSC45_29280 [Streptomyces sp. YIM 130001]